MSRLALALMLLPLGGLRAEEDSCPAGTQAVESDDPDKPAECAKAGLGRKFGSLQKVSGLKGFGDKPRCPAGFTAQKTPSSMQPYRCVQGPAPEEEELKPALNTLTSPVLGPAPAAETVRGGAFSTSGKAAKPPQAPASYRHFRAGTDVEFDYPRDWHVSDGWKDEPPTIYIVRDNGQAGKKVSFLIAENRKGRPGFVDMKAAIRRDKELQNAMEGGSGTVAGKFSRFLYVPHESHTAYVSAGPGLYYTLVFSAPEELGKTFKPAYDRLLKSFSIAGSSGEDE